MKSIIRERGKTAHGVLGALTLALTLTVASPGHSIQLPPAEQDVATSHGEAAADAAVNDDAAADGEAGDEASGAEEAGAELYSAIGCAGCHGAAGEGDRGPTLNGALSIRDTPSILNQILHGGSSMPPFRDQMTDEQVALLANWIRKEWGGRLPLPAIAVEEVTAIRNQ